ncbi:hypothetical protein OIE67_20490 [Nonomuraea fuscirosea]|uniref:hypothetical protein n=1 Tax=Nonomuraea fuscirosea TaxID=1291556 RepID=UPI002DDC5081|nr:hypothetical protein [Nonomuraea fuscirosea]WSA56901.1 hypothetical protein OIE67_20490 [Nonomuraea fuscirosea]
MTADPRPPGELPEPPMRPTLTREYLAVAALALIDAAGLRKFSMRKLGTAVVSTRWPSTATTTTRRRF